MSYSGIPYEALDSAGNAVMRDAKVIGELPHELRLKACEDAAQGIGRALGLRPIRAIPFGAPVYEAFGLTRPEAKAHAQCRLLLTLGHGVRLVYCA
ncbi:MAG: hypothetical protein PHV02_03300 [Rhodocyclaceae bacterium]|nr:hypothetical protein [Rhodocyclaceae bacterium]